MNITFIAPPAAGKGTQASKVSKEYGIPHISMGDLLRDVENPKIKATLSKGAFVDNRLVCHLLEERLSKDDCAKGFVLDGFPRTLEQASMYDEVLNKLHKNKGVVIVLNIDREIAAKRITGRKICPECDAVFNDLFKDSKSKVPDICDNCGSKLIRRTDDNMETFENRYSIYENETKPLIEYYEKKGMVYHVDSNVDANYTFGQIKKILGELYGKH